MGLRSFLNSDTREKKRKLINFVFGNQWARNHKPSLKQKIKNTWFLLTHEKECIVVDGWLLRFYDSKEKYSNWGDDLSVYLVELLCDKKVIPAETILIPHLKYSFVGSNLPQILNSKTVIWGSGVMNTSLKINRKKVERVCAVRGPITRKYLLKNGIDCPEIFGDPALLLPLYYKPKDVVKRHKIGIVPHHMDFDYKEELDELLGDGCHVISMINYDKWTDVIDDICSCEYILSNSLHGLIVADAYGVKNLFCEFVHHHANQEKFEDYFLSVKRPVVSPIKYDKSFSVEEAESLFNSTISIDVQKLLSAFPVK
ncbi:MAG: polysaccharide pyruvyl transferase family protein [Bacteroidales bacterium]|nr:polysaccharide pyruvyl transferase family protein [Bacteroidales bacterium]